ncbi:hypothetical protein [Agrobacterium larrymoorei]|uniref:Uncharacterized protein n=1 Tax=Agrobacterium larrymoorei TaxID=160699 RepID=A0A4D7E0S7_9HYPH|nr:hypothetical protein [Agrobacterium larrymoorei]QCJ00870.1 hypothetical protein CFBP5473_22975 [Agrobacterium larrymoorei]QYA10205.1 hypothetical protein J5285_23645 [Agrobacterium larrymoorei]
MDDFDGYFDPEERKKILAIARKLRFPTKRFVLISCLPEAYAQSLHNLPDDDAQLIADIDLLLRPLYLLDDSNRTIVPIVEWLERAALTFPNFPEAAELKMFAEKAKARSATLIPLAEDALKRRLGDSLKKSLRLFYMPFLTDHLISENAQINVLAHALEDAIKSHFKYEKNVFVRELSRKIKIEWDDEARTRIKVSDHSVFEFVPFNYEDITWKTERYATGELSTCDYEIRRDDVWLSGRMLEAEVSVNYEKQLMTSTYGIDVKDPGPFKIKAVKETCWFLDSDPVFEQTSPYVVQGCKLEIQNSAPGLRVVFHDVGGAKLFSPDPEFSGSHKWDVISFGSSRSLDSVPVLLPEQGYILVMSRTLAGLDDSAEKGHVSPTDNA